MSNAASQWPGDKPPTNGGLRSVLTLASKVAVVGAGAGRAGRDDAARFVVTGAEVDWLRTSTCWAHFWRSEGVIGSGVK